LHLYAIKDINANGLMCIPDTPETIGIGVSLNGNQTTPLVPQNFPNILSWSINTATYNGIIITTECTN
jgi:hypothetical protein